MTSKKIEYYIKNKMQINDKKAENPAERKKRVSIIFKKEGSGT